MLEHIRLTNCKARYLYILERLRHIRLCTHALVQRQGGRRNWKSNSAIRSIEVDAHGRISILCIAVGYKAVAHNRTLRAYTR